MVGKEQAKSVRRPAVHRGDVFELAVAGGFAYAQVTHRHTASPRYGWYIRVLPGTLKCTPSNLKAIVEGKEIFGAFCPFVGELKCIGKYPIPDFAKSMPWFKHNPVPNPPADAVWGLWKGCETSHDMRLSKGLPRWAVDAPFTQLIDITTLRERIDVGWTPSEKVKPHHLTATISPEEVSTLPTWSDFWTFKKENSTDDFWVAYANGWRPKGGDPKG